jgi:hypothetical protein
MLGVTPIACRTFRELTVGAIRRTIMSILPSDFAFVPLGDAELCVGVALVASSVSARRATRVDPATVLRSE